MGNVGFNNYTTPVSKPSIVRLKMNGGVENGAGTVPTVQIGRAQKGCSLAMRSFPSYDVPKPSHNAMQPTITSGARLATFGGLNAADGSQLGNKTVFNLYEVVSLMITLSNDLNKSYREQMAARVVGEISKLNDEARTLTNAAQTSRATGIASAAAGFAMAGLSVGGTFATAGVAKGAKVTSGLDSAMTNFKAANADMKGLQGFANAKEAIKTSDVNKFDTALKDTFAKGKGFENVTTDNVESALEQKTKDIRKFADNGKSIVEMKNQLAADKKLQKPAEPIENKAENKVQGKTDEQIKKEEMDPNKSMVDKRKMSLDKSLDKQGDLDKGMIQDDNKSMLEKDEVGLDKSMDKKEEIKSEEVKGEEVKNEGKADEKKPMSKEVRQRLEDKIKRLELENDELDAKYDIRNQYGDVVDGKDPVSAYKNELHARFEGKPVKSESTNDEKLVFDESEEVGVNVDHEVEIDEKKFDEEIQREFAAQDKIAAQEKAQTEEIYSDLSGYMDEKDFHYGSNAEVQLHDQSKGVDVQPKLDDVQPNADAVQPKVEPLSKNDVSRLDLPDGDFIEVHGESGVSNPQDNVEIQGLVNEMDKPQGKSFSANVKDDKSIGSRSQKKMNEAGAKWLERQDALLKGDSDDIENQFGQAKQSLSAAQQTYRTLIEDSKAYQFSQVVGSLAQGLTPVLQLLTSGAGVNELANARTKELQAGERADSYNASEMQALKDGLKGIVDAALQVISATVSSGAQFWNVATSNFRC